MHRSLVLAFAAAYAALSAPLSASAAAASPFCSVPPKERGSDGQCYTVRPTFLPRDSNGAGGAGANGMPGAPGPGGPATGSGPSAGDGSETRRGMDDPTSWRHWWDHNREPFLVPRVRSARTGSDDFSLGHGVARGARETAIDAATTADVLAALAGVLEHGGSAEELSSAALAYGRAAAGRESRAVELLVPLLDDGNYRVARAATVGLGLAGDARAFDALSALLNCRTDLLNGYGLVFGAHVSTDQRAFAGYALGLLGSLTPADGYWRTRIANLLAESVYDEQHRRQSFEVQAACVTAQGLLALPPRHPDAEGSSTALCSLQDQLGWLGWLFDQEALDPRVRCQIPTAMARLLAAGPPVLRERSATIARLLKEADEAARERHSLRQSAVIALGWIGDADGDPHDVELRERLGALAADAGDQLTRRLALIALARAAGRGGHAGPDRFAGTQDARRVLLRGLSKGNSLTRPWAALGLGVLERSLEEQGRPTSEDTARALRAAFERATNPHERCGVALALGLVRDSEAGSPRGVLSRALARTSDPELTADLALALGMVESTAARPALRELCRDSADRAEPLGSAALALWLGGDETVPTTLVARAGTARSQQTASVQLRAVEQIRGSPAGRPVAALIELTARGDLTQGTRAAALAALGAAAERSRLPWDATLAAGAAYSAGLDGFTSSPRGLGLLGLD